MPALPALFYVQQDNGPCMPDDVILTSLLEYFKAHPAGAQADILQTDLDVQEQAFAQRDQFREAAVLVPLIRSHGNTPSQIVMTLRSAHLKSHAGQVSLPGGRRDPGDLDAFATALRESTEEIGLDPQRVSVLGKLGEILLPSGFRVTPVIGLLEPGQSFKPCPYEVEEIFEAPLSLILNPESYRESTMTFAGKPRRIIEVNYKNYRIWGATAVILFHLAKEIKLFQAVNRF